LFCHCGFDVCQKEPQWRNTINKSGLRQQMRGRIQKGNQCENDHQNELKLHLTECTNRDEDPKLQARGWSFGWAADDVEQSPEGVGIFFVDS